MITTASRTGQSVRLPSARLVPMLEQLWDDGIDTGNTHRADWATRMLDVHDRAVTGQPHHSTDLDELLAWYHHRTGGPRIDPADTTGVTSTQ